LQTVSEVRYLLLDVDRSMIPHLRGLNGNGNRTSYTATAILSVPKPVFLRNGTAPSFLANGTSGLAATKTGTGTILGTAPANTSTPILDTSCGETTAPFAVKVHQPGGLFDGWHLKVSGNGLLFWSAAGEASRFSVEGSGHLCAVGRSRTNGTPAIVVVENTASRSSPVWLMYADLVVGYKGEYNPVSCAVGSGVLACVETDMWRWIGCGMQLGLSAANATTVPVDALNCTSINLTTD
jgi:hypothetical protein